MKRIMIQVYCIGIGVCHCFEFGMAKTFEAGERRVLFHVSEVGNTQIDRNGKNERQIKLAKKYMNLGEDVPPIMLSNRS